MTDSADMPPGKDPEKHHLEALLHRASEGDQSAWREIVWAYSPRLFGLLRAQGADADLAEEITQSAFCTIAAKIGSYTELGKFEAWIFRIGMNRLRDEMRRRKRQAMPMEDGALRGLAGAAEQAAGPDAMELAALREAVAALSDAEQIIIHLRHHGELSFKQIAEMLEQPLGTVLARHHRALKKLRDLLVSRLKESEGR